MLTFILFLFTGKLKKKTYHQIKYFSFLLFIRLGTIGFLACFWFVRKIYSVIKVD
jgi:hypothetical protein